MRRLMVLITWWALGAGMLYAQDEQPDLGTEAQREAGRQLYMQRCAQCHAASGNGQGIATPYMKPSPRDFTAGIFKVRTTNSGQLPTDEDLRSAIRNGMPYAGMPAWDHLSEQQITQLMYFIKTFNDDFAGPYGTPEEVEIPDPPSYSDASAERGREVYIANQCHDCHGMQGRGDGSSAPTLENDAGEHIRPADMTKRWRFKGGTSRRDIYRTFTTGMDGSPMPAYTIPEEDRWALVDYVYSLSRDDPNYATLVVAQSTSDALDLSQGPALFETAETAYFPVVGQVIEAGRSFQPGVYGVEVKAVYNQDEIAFMLTWHTMTPDTSGTNSPMLTVPSLAERADTIRKAPADTENPTPRYSDAVALQFPASPTEGTEKPYFLFGDADHPVDLWFADMAQDTAAVFVGQGTGTLQSQADDLEFYSSYEAGAWTAIFKRQRVMEDGLSFEPETFVPVTFSVWDGFNEERGAKRGISSWYNVYLAPMETRSAAVPMAQYALIVLIVELAIIYRVRRKHKGAVV